jgi:hydrogenase maturation protease
MKPLVVGLGNPILSDDGVGIRVAQEIKNLCPNIEIIEASVAGFRLLDEIIGYDKVIIIDAMQKGEGTPGKLHRLSPENFASTLHGTSPHDISFFEALKIMQDSGAKLPSTIIIYGIEVQETSLFSENCTEEVQKQIPTITREIIKNEL